MSNLISDLKTFIRFLESKSIPYKIVGSLALEACGFPLNREVHDIDIEVKGDYDEFFKNYADAYGNDFYKQEDSYAMSGHKPYIFKWGDTLVNVWVQKEFSSPAVIIRQGMMFDTLRFVLQRKLAYHRQKDYDDLQAGISVLQGYWGK